MINHNMCPKSNLFDRWTKWFPNCRQQSHLTSQETRGNSRTSRNKNQLSRVLYLVEINLIFKRSINQYCRTNQSRMEIWRNSLLGCTSELTLKTFRQFLIKISSSTQSSMFIYHHQTIIIHSLKVILFNEI